ncbi:MAG: CPBP family intramembrane metalloprotease, partial [Deltaproteobacteria bacterium]|nr:CPBP family intramembrane metalloprotease [Deltaproteobacteria bacterium]
GAVLAAVLVGFDFVAPFGFDPVWARSLPFAVALPVYGLAWGWNGEALGLRLRPRQGWGWWVRAGLVLGGLVLVVVGVVGGVGLLVGVELPPPVEAPWGEWVVWFRQACLQAPLVEEGTYRFVLCLPLLALWGRWPAILGSAVVFALLHVRYGVPAPDNFAGGFVFAWSYVASGTLVVPIVLHACGNLFVIGSQALYAWWMMG